MKSLNLDEIRNKANEIYRIEQFLKGLQGRFCYYTFLKKKIKIFKRDTCRSIYYEYEIPSELAETVINAIKDYKEKLKMDLEQHLN